MSKSERRNEVKIAGSKIEEIDLSILGLYKACKSVCKILYKISDNEYKKGTGFFIKLYKGEKELYCLLSNEHVITKELIEFKAIIDIIYNENEWKKIKLDKIKRFILYDEQMDITIIEIIEDDNIKEDYFLLPNIDNINYINKDIYILHFPEGKNLSRSKGTILDIDEYELIHNASTEIGSSGAPILLNNTTKVVGIHKQGDNYNKKNYGTLISSILELLQSQKKDDEFKKIKYKNGEFYIGQVLDGNKQGEGTLYYKNGNIKYIGDFINDKFEGKGKYIYQNGEYYIGEWLNDKKQGKGIFY